MNYEERIKVGEVWMALSDLHQRQLSAPALKLLLDAIDDLPCSKVLNALQDTLKNSKSGFPMPAQIRELCDPASKVSDRDIANELARKVNNAVCKHGAYWESGIMRQDRFQWEGNGRYWPTFKDAVIAELGPLGWHLVCSRGGWLNVRNSANDMEEGMFIAQMRDQIESSLRLQRAGIDLTKTQLPEPQKRDGLTSTCDILQLLLLGGTNETDRSKDGGVSRF